MRWEVQDRLVQRDQGLNAYIQTDIIQKKGIRFPGDSLKRPRAFPDDARQDAGYQLDKMQREEQLHAFPKKTRATSKRDIALARARWSQSMEY
jgi:phage-related protein